MLKWLKQNPFIFTVILGIILALSNYTPGTFLSGWDTLHPEFNFGLGWEREIFGVFRSEQGLGAVAAHSHMADLPHLIILYFMHFILPMSLLRYLFIFSNLILGPVGMYFFLNKHVVKNKTAAFLGSLFYLLNLGTLQIFTVPFEMFTVQYAVLPWIFLFATNYIHQSKSPKQLLFFSVVMLLASPTAYAATLWYLFFFIFIAYLFFLNLLDHSILNIRRSLLLVILTLAINSFWILPNIYFVLSHAQDVPNALINQLFSRQAFLYNKEFGNIKDILLMKNFLFDWNIYAGNNNFDQVLAPWIVYLSQKPMQMIGYVFALFSIVGIISGVIKKNKVIISFTPPLLICLIFLFNDNFLAGPIYNFIQDKIPFFEEALRFPGDKILGIFTFLFAIYFAKGQELISERLKRGQIVYIFVFSLLLAFYMLPAFQGNLINPRMRVQIPKYYFEMFEWFNSKPHDARIAELPINSLWGWKYYDWYEDTKLSFQGADFLQFGIPQPLLDRDFDRWSPYNEQYYREMSYAVYSKSSTLIRSVLDKYSVKYILLDTSIITPKNDPKTLFYPEIIALLEKDNLIKKVKTFGDNLFIYEVKSQNQTDIIKNPLMTSLEPLNYYEDFVYKTYGNYINQTGGLILPFANLIDNQSKIYPKFIQFNQTGIDLKGQTAQFLNLPSLIDTEAFINAQLLIEKKNNLLNVNIYPVLPCKSSSPSSSLISIPFTSSDDEFIVSVNQKGNAAFNLKDNTPLAIGNAQLNTTKTNTVSIYSLDSDKTTFSNLSEINYSLSYCNETTDQEIFGIEQGIKKNSFYLFGKNNPICMFVPLNQFEAAMEAQEALIGINLKYKSFLPSSLCIAKNHACIDQLIKYNDANYAAVNKEDLDTLTIKLSVNTNSKTQADKALIENFSIDILNPLSEAIISRENIEKLVENAKTENVQAPIITIPFSGDNALGSKGIFAGENQTYTTDSPSEQTSKGKQVIKDGNGDYIRYSSTNGSVSDHFVYQHLPQDRGYLLVITSRNQQGLPLTLCVTNETTRRCDIYAILSPFKDFAKDVFLLPKQLEDESGFDLNINNLGIKGTPAVNDLKSAEIVPFYYQYVSQISAGNNLKMSEDIFVLSETFEPGWKAYLIKDVNWIKTLVPFISGQELEHHVLVNGWANGWLLENSISKTQDSKIIVVFWPQYLEYLGLGILTGTFVLLLIARRKIK